MKTRKFKCELCGKRVERVERGDCKFRFCGRSCAGRAGITLASKVDRSGDRNPAWKRGYIIVGGYKLISIGNKKRKFEHRIVMEEFLGRSLTKEEKVHHINGDKLDNRIENLELCTQSEHMRKHKHLPTMYWLGKKRSEQTKKKISDAVKKYYAS